MSTTARVPHERPGIEAFRSFFSAPLKRSALLSRTIRGPSRSLCPCVFIQALLGKNIAQGKHRAAEVQEFAHQREGGARGSPLTTKAVSINSLRWRLNRCG